MNGAEALMRTARAAGIDLCLANPGTTEMPLVAALDATEGMRAVLGLHENVCTGAADGYGRMTGRPALTLLHLGPGLANGLANLHNARRAGSPVLNLIGEHATWHRAADAPLTMDIEALAGTVSAHVCTSRSAEKLADDMAQAIAAAGTRHVATLIAAHDHQTGPARAATPRLPEPEAPRRVPTARVEGVARELRGAGRKAVLLGGAALQERGLALAGGVARACGADLYCDTFPARVERGAGRAAVQRLPYFPEQVTDLLSRYAVVVLAGTRAPVSFFGYEGQPSVLLEESAAAALATPDEDVIEALDALVDALGPTTDPGFRPPETPAPPVSDTLDPGSLSARLAALQPEGAIVVETAATTGLAYYPLSMNAPAHTYLALTGGAIGQGPPCAVGAALACPDRRVINFQADGSAAYTLQALWTQARESLDVITVLCSNRRYAILQVELMRAGVPEPGPVASSLTDLSNPDLDWVKLAEGFGVPGVAVRTTEEFERAFSNALTESGPRLIEAIL